MSNTPESSALITWRIEQLELKVDNVLARLEHELGSVNEKLSRLLSHLSIDEYKHTQLQNDMQLLKKDMENLKAHVETNKGTQSLSMAAKYAPPAITAASITAIAEVIRQLILAIGH